MTNPKPINIALALGLLGDQLGRDELKKVCAEEEFPSEFRMYAVRYMFNWGAVRRSH